MACRLTHGALDDTNDCDGHEPNTISVVTKIVQSFNMMFKDLQNLGPTLKCEVHCPCPKSSTHFLLSLQMSTEYALHIHVRIHDIVEYITINTIKPLLLHDFNGPSMLQWMAPFRDHAFN